MQTGAFNTSTANVANTLIHVETGKMTYLQHKLLQASFLNLFIVAMLGVVLRSYPFLQVIPFEYKNLLHGHSHFAFGGWVMPVLLALILKTFPELADKISYHHWRNIVVLLLASAYGMLLSFPFQGYGVVSIIFSTISVGAGYYFAFLLWKAIGNTKGNTSYLFLKAGLFYLSLSAIGPFATGPLIAMGKAGTPIYYNSVYFYLHFQYNGWFTFAVLALLYKLLQEKGGAQNGQRVFKLFNWACLPAFALSVLWNNPPVIWNILGGAAGILQMIGLYFLWKDVRVLKMRNQWEQTLLKLAFTAFVIKNILQLLSALPYVANLAHLHRNFVIAYLHLVLLGIISMFVFAVTFTAFRLQLRSVLKWGFLLFLTSFVTTEILLVLFSAGNLFHFSVPYYSQLLLFFSLFFPAGLLAMYLNIRRQLKTVAATNSF